MGVKKSNRILLTIFSTSVFVLPLDKKRADVTDFCKELNLLLVRGCGCQKKSKPILLTIFSNSVKVLPLDKKRADVTDFC